MAKKISDMSLHEITVCQQVIDFSSRDFHNLFQAIEQAAKDNRVSVVYRNEMRDKIQNLINKNNSVQESLEKELFSRVKKRLPECETSLIMPGLVRSFEKFQDEWANASARSDVSQKKEKKPKVNMKPIK